ncbi:glycosyltransferase family 4 protein, partial [Candidatus Peregrinibacteria bacterium]|nr:glycosyltransferase family 4 protein [Candidatus Peregrinibacteria bacterium]
WHLRTLRHLKKTKPDLFWAPTSFIIPALAPKSLTTFITVHDIVAFLFPQGHNRKAVYLERLTLRRALSKSSRIFTVSRNTKTDLIKLFNIDETKIIIAPCSASAAFTKINDENLLGKTKKKFDLPEKFILGVGTLSPRKNFTRLIQAFAQIAPEHPDTHLVIVGNKGWDFDDILKGASRKKVHLIGYVESFELISLYNLAQVFVFPSLYEGFGIPPLEAMSCGCPVVTSNISSLPEVVGDSALLIDPYSTEEIAGAIGTLLSNKDLHADLGRKGLRQATKFSWEKSAKVLLEVFESLKTS